MWLAGRSQKVFVAESEYRTKNLDTPENILKFLKLETYPISLDLSASLISEYGISETKIDLYNNSDKSEEELFEEWKQENYLGLQRKKVSVKEFVNEYRRHEELSAKICLSEDNCEESEYDFYFSNVTFDNRYIGYAHFDSNDLVCSEASNGTFGERKKELVVFDLILDYGKEKVYYEICSEYHYSSYTSDFLNFINIPNDFGKVKSFDEQFKNLLELTDSVLHEGLRNGDSYFLNKANESILRESTILKAQEIAVGPAKFSGNNMVYWITWLVIGTVSGFILIHLSELSNKINENKLPLGIKDYGWIPFYENQIKVGFSVFVYCVFPFLICIYACYQYEKINVYVVIAIITVLLVAIYNSIFLIRISNLFSKAEFVASEK